MVGTIVVSVVVLSIGISFTFGNKVGIRKYVWRMGVSLGDRVGGCKKKEK